MPKRIEYDERTGELYEKAFPCAEHKAQPGAVIVIDGVEYVPLRTAYWVEVRSKNPTTATVHRCSNPECRLTTYAHRLPPYCQECGSKMLGKVREDDDKHIMQPS